MQCMPTYQENAKRYPLIGSNIYFEAILIIYFSGDSILPPISNSLVYGWRHRQFKSSSSLLRVFFESSQILDLILFPVWKEREGLRIGTFGSHEPDENWLRISTFGSRARWELASNQYLWFASWMRINTTSSRSHPLREPEIANLTVVPGKTRSIQQAK